MATRMPSLKNHIWWRRVFYCITQTEILTGIFHCLPEHHTYTHTHKHSHKIGANITLLKLFWCSLPLLLLFYTFFDEKASLKWFSLFQIKRNFVLVFIICFCYFSSLFFWRTEKFSIINSHIVYLYIMFLFFLWAPFENHFSDRIHCFFFVWFVFKLTKKTCALGAKFKIVEIFAPGSNF